MKASQNYSKPELDNRAKQLNDNNDAFWQSHSANERPGDWNKHHLDCSINRAVSMTKKGTGSGSRPRPTNAPSTTGKPSGGGRGNNPPSSPKK